MSCDLPFRSEMVVSPAFSAVLVSVPTAFESANGVGGKAVRPSFSRSAFAWV